MDNHEVLNQLLKYTIDTNIRIRMMQDVQIRLAAHMNDPSLPVDYPDSLAKEMYLFDVLADVEKALPGFRGKFYGL